MNGRSGSWRCIACGAYFAAHHRICSSCWHEGSLIPVAVRARAAVDFVPGESSARALARMAWGRVAQAAFPGLELGTRALLLVSGPPGAGKSSFACRLADAVSGPALLVSAEEGLGPSLAARLARCAVKREDFVVVTRSSVDQVVQRARTLRAASLVIDSVDAATYAAPELRHVLEVVPSLELLIGVMQVTKDGLPSGAMALQHESDCHVAVEERRWRLLKSRYQDLAGVGGDVLAQRRETEVQSATA